MDSVKCQLIVEYQQCYKDYWRRLFSSSCLCGVYVYVVFTLH